MHRVYYCDWQNFVQDTCVTFDSVVYVLFVSDSSHPGWSSMVWSCMLLRTTMASTYPLGSLQRELPSSRAELWSLHFLGKTQDRIVWGWHTHAYDIYVHVHYIHILVYIVAIGLTLVRSHLRGGDSTLSCGQIKRLGNRTWSDFTWIRMMAANSFGKTASTTTPFSGLSASPWLIPNSWFSIPDSRFLIPDSIVVLDEKTSGGADKLYCDPWTCCFELISSHRQGIRKACLAHHMYMYTYLLSIWRREENKALPIQ